jgi:hypothetical protein
MGSFKTNEQKATNRHIAWIVWGAAAFFDLFELFVRVMPGTMLQKNAIPLRYFVNHIRDCLWD